ncbi:arylsulfatase [Variovorax rhizosphaerae]|uniref:Arylsulfatase n=1 Tax=Variovorax rhizosphaerae TaxID=1836200 RepID=A0ABU8WXF7_9BURK
MSTDKQRPNILLVLADDLGFSDIGCYGSEIETPHLDRLAASGLRFTQMYNTSRCCPTRASLLTGLSPHRAGVGHMVEDLGVGPAYQGYLREDTQTIGELLKQAGYHTGLSGKWHVNWAVGGPSTPLADKVAKVGKPGYPHPLQRGFDRFYGTMAGAGSFFNPFNLMEQDQFVEPEGANYYYTDAISAKAIGMMEDAVAEGKPFFTHVCYTAPHWPLHAHPADIARYKDRYLCGWDAIRAQRHRKMQDLGIVSREWTITERDEYAPPWESLDEATRQWEAQRMAVYAAQITCMDRGIGSMLETLDRLGVRDNTIVMFLSDNGGCAEYLKEDGWFVRYSVPTRDGRPTRVGNEMDIVPGPEDTFMSYGLPWANASNTPFRLYKHYVHEGGIATPLVVSWPAIVKAARIDDSVVHVQDLLPTFADLAGATASMSRGDKGIQSVEGESFAAALQGDRFERDKPLCLEHEGNCAVRIGRWKAVRKYPGDWELYDMVVDRTETCDVSQQHADKLKALVAHYVDWAAATGVVDWPVESEIAKASALQGVGGR